MVNFERGGHWPPLLATLARMGWPFSSFSASSSPSPSASPSIRTVLVEGESMAPTYHHGDWLLVRFTRRGGIPRGIKVGHIVVIERELQPGVLFIKRITDIRSDSPNRHYPTYWVEGDNKVLSQDSRTWGAIAGEEILGRVLFRIRRSNESVR
jgi:signal peptidase I